MTGIWLKFAFEPGVMPISAEKLRETVMQACTELAIHVEHIWLGPHCGAMQVALFIDAETPQGALVTGIKIGALVAVRFTSLRFEGTTPIL